MTNQDIEVSNIRNRVHKYLEQVGLVEEIPVGIDNYIEIIETQESRFKKLVIEKLSFSYLKKDIYREIEKIWVLDVEKKYVYVLNPVVSGVPFGVSKDQKTPEKAVLVLQKISDQDSITLHYCLYIFLIELKSTLQCTKEKKGRTLKDISEKFQSAMNRIYMLLTFNDHVNSQKGYQGYKVLVKFKGLIFHGGNKIVNLLPTGKDSESIHDRNERSLFKMLSNQSYRGILTQETIFAEKDKIEIRFIEKSDPQDDTLIISLEELLQ